MEYSSLPSGAGIGQFSSSSEPARRESTITSEESPDDREGISGRSGDAARATNGSKEAGPLGKTRSKDANRTNHQTKLQMTAKNVSPVINPWLISSLIAALAGNVLLSAVLIVRLSHFDDAKIQADEVLAQTAKKRTELSGLQSEVESLTKRKEILEPAIADWQQRLEEKTAAEAALKSSEAKSFSFFSSAVVAHFFGSESSLICMDLQGL